MHLNCAAHAHENKKASGHAPESGKKVKENGRGGKWEKFRVERLSEIGQKTRSHGGGIAKKFSPFEKNRE